MSEKPVLYVGEKNLSSWSMRAWVALTWKGVPFEERTIVLSQDTTRAERRKVSPTGKLPVLHHGGLVIPDSLAIIEYLEETFPPTRRFGRPTAACASGPGGSPRRCIRVL
jgi:glutathione S-transferase